MTIPYTTFPAPSPLRAAHAPQLPKAKEQKGREGYLSATGPEHVADLGRISSAAVKSRPPIYYGADLHALEPFLR